jgi:hypothetical protein
MDTTSGGKQGQGSGLVGEEGTDQREMGTLWQEKAE